MSKENDPTKDELHALERDLEGQVHTLNSLMHKLELWREQEQCYPETATAQFKKETNTLANKIKKALKAAEKFKSATSDAYLYFEEHRY